MEKKSLVQFVEKEIRIHQNLSHPCIAKLYDVIYNVDFIALIIEYVENGDLFTLMEKNDTLPIPKVHKIMEQVFCVIEYLGNKGIVHCDIKPENILIDESFNIKIIDFGSSLETNLPTNKFIGSIPYMPPEALQFGSFIENKWDIWSAGVVMFELIYGFLPWDYTNSKTLIRSIENFDHITFPYDICKPAQAIISMCLNTNPHQRSSAQAILDLPWFKSKQKIPRFQKPKSKFPNTHRQSTNPILTKRVYYTNITQTHNPNMFNTFKMGIQEEHIHRLTTPDVIF